MPPKLVLLIGVIFALHAFRSDRKRYGKQSWYLFWPSLWYMIVASRPIGVWFAIWGFPLPGGGSGDATEGSEIDRFFYSGLAIIGLWILSKREFSWGATLGRNPWLTALIVLMAASIMWSKYPFVSFKRYIKVFGSVVMAMVVLSSEKPLEAFLTIIRRCLYVHLPMSIICTRWFRDIGISYDYSGANQSWTGISTSKNTLGQIAMLGALYFFWEVRNNWPKVRWRNLHILYLLMAIYLLKGSENAISMTSLFVCIFAVLVFLRIQALKSQPARVHSFVKQVFAATIALVVLVVVHGIVHFSEGSIFGKIITSFGRDITLTDRTFIWTDVYAAAGGFTLLGTGFGGFWIGRIANIPWNATMTWVLGQGHSGYVDTYLQLGVAGWVLLAGVLFSTLPRLLRSLATDFEFGCFRITLFLAIIFINITESTFLRGDHHLWLITMLILWDVPTSLRDRSRKVPHSAAERLATMPTVSGNKFNQ